MSRVPDEARFNVAVNWELEILIIPVFLLSLRAEDRVYVSHVLHQWVQKTA